MDKFIQILEIYSSKVNDDLNNLSESADPLQNEIIDKIRIELSSHIAEVRCLVVDRVRIRQMSVNTDNQLHTNNGDIIVGVYGCVKKPNTSAAVGAYMVVWNIAHALNICNENVLAIKTPNSSHVLGLLALLNQMVILNVSSIQVISSAALKKVYDQLPLWEARLWLDDNDALITNYEILKMIQTIISEKKISIKFQIPPIDPLLSLYDINIAFGEIANTNLRGKLSYISARQ